MTDTMPTTLRGQTEVSAFAHTPLSRGFCGLLRDLDAVVAAERPLQRGMPGLCAGEFDAALTTAELARTALLERLCWLIETPEERGEDRPLRLMALLLRTILGIEDDGDRVYVFSTVSEHAGLLALTGTGPAATVVRRLQQRFLAGLDALIALEDFGGAGVDPDDGVMAVSA